MVLVTCFGVSLLKIQVWDAMPCGLVHSCWHYEVRQCLLLQGQGIQKEWHISDCLTLEMKDCTLSKHQKLSTKSTQCSMPEDLNLYHNCCENIYLTGISPPTYILYTLLNHATELAFSILCFLSIKLLIDCTWSAVGIFFILYTYS